MSATSRPSKSCTKCKVIKPIDDFHRNKATRDGRTTRCRVCRSAYARERRAANPEAARAYARERYRANPESACERGRERYRANPEVYRRHRLRRRYGLTLEQFDSMKSNQAGRCAICEKELQPGNRTQVDHCHTTGFVRGILCRECNVGMGHFGDDPVRILNMFRYLVVSIAKAAA